MTNGDSILLYIGKKETDLSTSSGLYLKKHSDIVRNEEVLSSPLVS